jgi:hypothetical protein
MEAQGVILSGRPPGWTQRLIDQLVVTGRYRIAERSDGATVLVREDR